MVIPADTPLKIPEVPTVAIPVALLLQVPPGADAVNVMGVEIHITEPPVIVGDGAAFTVTKAVDVATPQPDATAYEMEAVPAVTPVTTPPLVIVAVPSASLVHVPPGIDALNVVVAAVHTTSDPVIVAGVPAAFTVTIIVAIAVPHELVTV
jgi:hypothetical protein